MITKTEWLSLKLYSEEISQLVYQIDSAEGLSSEAQLALELESVTISLWTLILQLRGQILANPRTSSNQELVT